MTTTSGRLPRLVELGGPIELGGHLVDIADELAGLRRRITVLAIEEQPREPGSRQRRHDGEQRVHAGKRVVLAGVHGVEQDDAADLGRIAVGIAEREHAAKRVPGEHVRPGDVRALEQDVQIARRVGARRPARVAAPVTGAVVGTTVVVLATSGAIKRAIAGADSPSPGSRTTVGPPEPMQWMYRRCRRRRR